MLKEAFFYSEILFSAEILPKAGFELGPLGMRNSTLPTEWGGWVVRRYWVNFQCRGVLLIWIIVGQGLIALAVGADGGCLDIFSLVCHICFLSPSLWETARYRLKYCLKGPLKTKTNIQKQNTH